MGAGECERLIESIDWSATSLGARASWSPALRAMVSNISRSRQPMLLFWGPDLIQFYNDAFVPSFGQGKHPKAMGQPAAECWQDAWPVVGAQIEAVMSRGEPAWFEEALVPIHRNGRMEEVFWTYSYSPAFDEAGRIAGTLVIVTEMTGRVVTARRLSALATLGKALAEATDRGSAIEALRSTVETEPQDLPFVLLGRHDGETDALGIDGGLVRSMRLDPKNAEIAFRAPLPCRAWPEPVTHGFAAELPGLIISFGLSPRLPFDEGYRSYLLQIVEQLSSALHRIDNAEASREIEMQRDNLLMHAPVATALLTGPHHVYQLANPLYCELVGRDPTGKPFAEALPELAGSDIERELDHVYRTGKGFVASERLIRLDRGDGELEDHWFNFNTEPLRGPNERVLGMMVVAVDVTSQVRANRAKDEFLAMLGHELRNPLAPIASAVELMKHKNAATSVEQETIERQLQHVTRLVDDLLDVSRITRGTIELVRCRIELGDVVARAVEITRHLIEQRDHRLTIDVRDGLFLDADEGRLTQVLSNLLTNAARYTPPGGEIRVLGQAEDDTVVLRIIDTGIGMDRELLERGFELFVQGQRGIDRREGGLGIGLALVNNLVVLHGGTVRAESDGPGRGSTLIVTLPRARPPSPSDAPEQPRLGLPMARSPKRVVVVDDNEDAAMLLAELLRACGHEVEIAHEGHAALRLVETFAPDVAVLDIGLPGMNGYALAGHIRETSKRCRLIALTGYGQEQDRQQALSAGFEAHFVKPVALNALLNVLM